MTTPSWVKDAIFYQIYPDRFAKSNKLPDIGFEAWDSAPTHHGFKGGDLYGVIEKLDYLQDLGINAIYFNPIFASASNHRYHTFDYYQVDPLLGGNDAFKKLLNAAHKRGIRVVLYGVIEKLDYLQDLGINAIYFNPIFASASNHRYHTFDYYQVDPLLGGNDAFKKLLNAAHKRGIRVVLDGVFNHASRGFWQFNHVLETGAASPYKDWFHFDEERLKGHKHWGAYPSPHEQKLLHQEDSLTAIGYRAWWNLPALPKFNTNTPAVREFLFDVAEYWIKFGIDGWRLDVPGEIDDDEFWREFRRRVRAINPDAYIVGEIWHEAQRWLQGDQFDAVMNYLFTAASLNFFAHSNLNMDIINHAGGLKDRIHPMNANSFANEVERILHLYPQDITFAQLNLLDSHDMPRFLSCANGDKNSLKLAWLFLLSMPGAPCIYYGDEVGVDGGHDPECRKAFPWDESKWDTDLLAYAKACIALRNKHKSLRHGTYRRVHTEDHVMVYARETKSESILVAFNASASEKNITLDLPHTPKILFGTATVTGTKLSLPPRSGAVLK